MTSEDEFGFKELIVWRRAIDFAKQFLYIARGSIYETITFLNIMKELNWLSTEKVDELEKEGLALNKMLNSLINKLKTD